MPSNFSLPQSPDRPFTPNSERNSKFLDMAMQLHRLRLAASSPIGASASAMVPKSSERAPSVVYSRTWTREKREDVRHPPQSESTDFDWQHSDGSMDHPGPSQAPSVYASLSDVSIASFYRLPTDQNQHASQCGFVGRDSSSSSFQNGKNWSSEPVLTPVLNTSAPGDTTADILDSIGPSRVNAECTDNTAYRKQETGKTNSDGLQSTHDMLISNRISILTSASQRMGPGDPVHNRPGLGATTSWNYTELEGTPATAIDKPSVDNSGHSRASAVNADPVSMPLLPPLSGTGRLQPKIGVLNSNGTSNAKNGSVGNSGAGRMPAPLPPAASRLMEAISKHPSGELDYARLKAMLREQRKSYKRRLEKEKAKREALEELLVKLNSTPRYNAFSNDSSNGCSTRAISNRNGVISNGRSLADLNDLGASSLPSNSSDGNSTSSEDAFILELIQQHLRLKQAMLGLSGKRDANGRDDVSNGRALPRLTGRTVDGVDEDDIPIGGEAPGAFQSPRSDRVFNGAGPLDPIDGVGALPRSRSLDYGRRSQRGPIDKERLKLALGSTSSTGGSERGRGASPTGERRQRRKWETGCSVRSSVSHADTGERRGKKQETPAVTPRPSVAFFVSVGTDNEKNGERHGQNGLVALKVTKPLQDAFRERQSRFLHRSMHRQDRIRAASELRSEMARQVREIAENVTNGRISMDDANQQLLLYELPQPTAFSPLEMYRASKIKYEQLPETVARRNRLKKEADYATNRVLAKMYKQKLAYKRQLWKMKARSSSAVPSSTHRRVLTG